MSFQLIKIKKFINAKSTKIYNGINNEIIIAGLDKSSKSIQILVFDSLEEHFKPMELNLKCKMPIKDYDMLINEKLFNIFVLHNGFIANYESSRQNKIIVSGSGDSENYQQLELENYLSFKNLNSQSLQISRNGSVAAVTCSDGEIYVYDVDEILRSKLTNVTKLSSQPLLTVRDISPDATSLVTLSKPLSKAEFWNIEKCQKVIELFYKDDYQIADCCYGRIEAVSHIYNLYTVYNNKSGYCLCIWDCSKLKPKNSKLINNKVAEWICVSHEGRYLSVFCSNDCSIDVFVAFNFQKLFTFDTKTKLMEDLLSIHFLPLTVSLNTFQHEFDLISLFKNDKDPEALWFYEPIRPSYSIIWPIIGAVIIIIAFFYFVSYMQP